jgi:transcriptional regulator with XRE-family HTH domain
MNSVGDRLDFAMKRANVPSQSALSRKSGVPQPTIARILNYSGKGAPESATINKLATACSVSFAWLNEGKDTEKASELNHDQVSWLALMDYLGNDDVAEFTTLIKQRQERNRRLQKEFGAI